MNIKEDYIEKFEYLTIYPNAEGGNVLLATLLTRAGYRAIMYSPSVSPINIDLDTISQWEEYRDARNIPIGKLEQSREVRINGQIFAYKNKLHEKENWFFKVVYLDGPMSKTIVKKEEVEKLFGCQIDG